MKTSSTELKKRAKLTLSGNYGTSVGAMLILGAVTVISTFILIGTMVVTPILSWTQAGRLVGGDIARTLITMFIVMLLISLLIYLLVSGVRRMFFNMSIDQPFSIGDMLFAFTHKPHRFLGIYLINMGVGLVLEIPYYVVSFVAGFTEYMPLMVVLQILMYLFLLIGMIAYWLHFGMASYLLLEEPERTVIGCFRESAAIMKGNKGRLFYLVLSFIGMLLLGAGSFGIGFLWIYPYMETTMMHFFLDISTCWRQADPYYSTETGYGGPFEDGIYESGQWESGQYESGQCESGQYEPRQ